ncbi:MAG TPA: DUF3047 domain-containing protein [Acidimicrobiales bacterium]|jgi:hypothetical protein
MAAQEPEPFHRALERALERALASGDGVADHRFVDLPANEPPWADTGLEVRDGDQITIVRHGRSSLAGTSLWLEAGFNVWARVGGRGPLERGTRATHTFRAVRDGTVQLGNAQPAEWTDRDGAIEDDPGVYALMEGGAEALLIRWADGADPLEALRGAAERSADPWGYLAGEVARLEYGLGAPPPGWEHLWFLGPSEVFTRSGDVLDCVTRGDAAIICHDAAFDLGDDTVLEWSWRVDALPSLQPEDALETHDYLSLAVEFDDGQDLTYHWSAGLPAGTSYRCPLPHWSARETHLVLGSGPEGLGHWHNEARHLRSDYARAIGGTTPARVTRIWLIALSAMQHLEGRGAYRGITLRNDSQVLGVV